MRFRCVQIAWQGAELGLCGTHSGGSRTARGRDPRQQKPDVSTSQNWFWLGNGCPPTISQVNEAIEPTAVPKWRRKPHVSTHSRSLLPFDPPPRPRWQREPDVSTHATGFLPNRLLSRPDWQKEAPRVCSREASAAKAQLILLLHARARGRRRPRFHADANHDAPWDEAAYLPAGSLGSVPSCCARRIAISRLASIGAASPPGSGASGRLSPR